jgi:hypothetical protein
MVTHDAKPMTEPEADDTVAPTPPADDRVEHRTQTASKWLRKVEASIGDLFHQRNDIREEIRMQRGLRCANNPLGEEKLSHGQAHQVAKSQVMGVQWQRARHSLKQATQNARSARGHLQRLSIERQVVRERSRSWTFWLVKAPYLAWKARPINRRLREAVHQRRSALKVIRVLRPAAADPLIGARISALTEVLLINDERLSHSIQNLQSADQAASLQISEALRLAPQLRALGEAQVTMEQKLDPVAQRHSLPKPLQPLESVAPLPTRKPGMRIR